VAKGEGEIEDPQRSSTPLHSDGRDVDMQAPDKKRIRSTNASSSSSDDSDSSSASEKDSTFEEDPNSETVLQINELANELPLESLKFADFIMARLGARDRYRDSKIDKLGKRLQKDVKKISDAVDTAATTADEALTTAQEAKSVAEEAMAVAVATREETSTEMAEIRKQIAEQGKKIHILEHQRGFIDEADHPGSRRPAPRNRVLKMNANFENLLAKTGAMKTYFVMGLKKDWQGELSADRAKEFLNMQFPSMEVFVMQPPNAKFVRFHVGSIQEAEVVALAIETRWSEFAEVGWWLREETPVEMRSLENCARQFIIEAKKSDDVLKKKIGYVAFQQGNG
jgi:hypothetical protein